MSTGSGFGWDRVCISVHKDYSDYSKVMQDFKSEWGQYCESFSSFIVSLQSDNILRNLSFKHLTKLLKKSQTEE
jgi:hypothetical protein